MWVWEYETEEGTHDLFMDIGEEIRFRVIDETFTDMTPVGPEKPSKDKQTSASDAENKKSPYVITVSSHIIMNTADFRKNFFVLVMAVEFILM